MFSRIGPRFTSSSSSFSLFSSVPISRTANPGRWKCVQRRGYGAGWGPRPQYKRFNQAQHQRGGWLLRWAAKPTFFRDVAVISAGAGGFFIWNLEEVPVCIEYLSCFQKKPLFEDSLLVFGGSLADETVVG